MKVKVLGIQNVDYVSRKTGNPVKGTTLHCSFPDAQVQGDAVESIFVSDNLRIDCISKIKPDSAVNVEYNHRGYVCNVTLLS